MANLKRDLVAELERLPGVTHRPWPERNDGFSTVHFAEREIAHFHNLAEIDIRLGKSLIRQEGLVHPSDSTKHPKRSPNSQFIEVRFSTPAEVRQIVRLVQLAIAD